MQEVQKCFPCDFEVPTCLLRFRPSWTLPWTVPCLSVCEGIDQIRLNFQGLCGLFPIKFHTFKFKLDWTNDRACAYANGNFSYIWFLSLKWTDFAASSIINYLSYLLHSALTRRQLEQETDVFSIDIECDYLSFFVGDGHPALDFLPRGKVLSGEVFVCNR